MKPKMPLQAKDFPVQADDTKITKSDGVPIAEAEDDQLAQDICDRLNADNDREEDDRWA
jgi:hypothetical protein